MSRFGRIQNVKSRRKYSDVFDALKEEIVGGKYCAGSVFPSHAMIVRRFGISNLISGPNWMKHIVGCAVAAAGFCGLADSLTVGMV